MNSPDTLPEQPAGEAERYLASLQRARVPYAIVLTVIAALFATIFTVVWLRGSAAHATLHSVAAGPANVALATPSATQTTAWTTTDRAAEDQPQWQGTIVTWSSHTLRGRNATTGAQTWSYTRSDRTMCWAGEVNGTAIGLYRRTSDCDELDAFNAATGQRAWTRTLDINGEPVNGIPDVQLSATTLLITTAAVSYAIDPGGGLDRWDYTRYGCTIGRAVLGDAGVLFSQTCDNRVDCTSSQDCATGTQLILRNPTAGADTDNKTNPDQFTWFLKDNTDRPVSVDGVITARRADGRLDVLDAGTGAVDQTLDLAGATAAESLTATQLSATSTLIQAGQHTYAVTSAGVVEWTAATSGLPFVTGIGDYATSVRVTALTSPPITVLDPMTGKVIGSASIVSLAPDTGQLTGAYNVPGSLPSGGTVVPLGTGFLVTSATGTTVYR